MERFKELSIEERRHPGDIVAEAERGERERQGETPMGFPCCDEPWYKSN